jgi:hypothetical protein
VKTSSGSEAGGDGVLRHVVPGDVVLKFFRAVGAIGVILGASDSLLFLVCRVLAARICFGLVLSSRLCGGGGGGVCRLFIVFRAEVVAFFYVASLCCHCLLRMFVTLHFGALLKLCRKILFLSIKYVLRHVR